MFAVHSMFLSDYRFSHKFTYLLWKKVQRCDMIILNYKFMRNVLMNDIGKRIKHAREKKKLTVEKIAKKMKIEPKLLLDWESGESEPDTKSANKLANILSVSGDYLLFGIDNASGVHTMFPTEGKPQPAGMDAILAFVSAMLLFVGIGGLILLFVITGSRLVTAGNLGFWEYFILSGTVYSAIGFVIIAVIGAAAGLVSIALMNKNKKKSKGKRK